jgi:hypothetical protein
MIFAGEWHFPVWTFVDQFVHSASTERSITLQGAYLLGVLRIALREETDWVKVMKAGIFYCYFVTNTISESIFTV